MSHRDLSMMLLCLALSACELVVDFDDQEDDSLGRPTPIPRFDGAMPVMPDGSADLDATVVVPRPSDAGDAASDASDAGWSDGGSDGGRDAAPTFDLDAAAEGGVEDTGVPADGAAAVDLDAAPGDRDGAVDATPSPVTDLGDGGDSSDGAADASAGPDEDAAASDAAPSVTLVP